MEKKNNYRRQYWGRDGTSEFKCHCSGPIQNQQGCKSNNGTILESNLVVSANPVKSNLIQSNLIYLPYINTTPKIKSYQILISWYSTSSSRKKTFSIRMVACCLQQPRMFASRTHGNERDSFAPVSENLWNETKPRLRSSHRPNYYWKRRTFEDSMARWLAPGFGWNSRHTSSFEDPMARSRAPGFG